MTATITKILKFGTWFGLCVTKNNIILSISDIFTVMNLMKQQINVPLED